MMILNNEEISAGLSMDNCLGASKALTKSRQSENSVGVGHELKLAVFIPEPYRPTFHPE
jgi:hypothetical protein